MNFPRVLLAGFIAAALPLFAAPVVKTEHVEAQLLPEQTHAQPGKTVVVGLRLQMIPHWHTYWKNPGDSGLPTRVKWTLPAGWSAGAFQWPHPKNLPVGPLNNYGYEDEVVLLTEITVPPDAKPGTVPIKASADWLVCKEICIPEKGELDLALKVDAAPPAESDRWKPSFDRARAMLPVSDAALKADAGITGKNVVLRLALPSGLPTKVTFFPERDNVIEAAAPQRVVRSGDALLVEMKLQDPVPKDFTVLKGVVVGNGAWPGAADRRAMEVSAPVGSPIAMAAGSTAGGGSAGGSTGGSVTSSAEVGGSVATALLFALLGGLLLNLMPCVFPVLGIKVMGFVEHAHGDAKALRLQGIVFTVGVLVSFLVLAGLMLALRAGGTQLGWGFQLQSPAFVTLLAMLFFVLALNLAGVFEWGLFAQSMTSDVSAKGRNADAFLAGVLASVVATPCTAPFMGAAVGFTLAQPAAVSLAVFFALGAGMALPVLLLSFFPALLKKLPKPGAWMETFKQVMAFPLFATVAWLAWVLGAQSGNDGVFGLLLGLVAIAIGAWIYGRWAHSESTLRPVFAVLFAALGVYVAWPDATASVTPGVAVNKAGELPWQPWSPEKVAELTAAGKPVFVDYTAAWCVTCQVNKRVVLNSSSVVAAFAQRGIVPLKADWTNNDPRITQSLQELGRNAVPVYVLYLPGEAKPRLLPEVLTSSLVLAEIDKLPTGTKTAITQR
jgi:thiol:disulfide interchange protein DsbD